MFSLGILPMMKLVKAEKKLRIIIRQFSNMKDFSFGRLYFKFPPPPIAQQHLVGQGLLVIDASLSHLDTPHSVGIFWTTDRADTETST